MIAFEITPEDLANVLRSNGLRNFSEQHKTWIFDNFIAPEDGRIERAALQANDMEAQTKLAYLEITEILKENKLI